MMSVMIYKRLSLGQEIYLTTPAECLGRALVYEPFTRSFASFILRRTCQVISKTSERHLSSEWDIILGANDFPHQSQRAATSTTKSKRLMLEESAKVFSGHCHAW